MMRHQNYRSASEFLESVRVEVNQPAEKSYNNLIAILAPAYASLLTNQEYDRPEIVFTPKVVIILSIWRSIVWFGQFGIEDADYRDVQNQSYDFYRYALDHEFNELNVVVAPGWRERNEDEKIEAALNRIPGFKEWHKLARARFDELKHSEKYRGEIGGDPHGR